MVNALKLSSTVAYTGNYQFLRPLGQGGTSIIYLGKHRYLGTYVAIKMLRADLPNCQVKQFCIEAKIAASLMHRHIVRVLDFGFEGAVPFLVMEYAPYGTLRDSHPTGQVLPLATIVSYVKQIASAVQYIHDCGFIHQDLKPANILLGRNKQVLLTDFGIAIAAYRANDLAQHEHAGTLPYIAPEQLQGTPCQASDQYALGIIVYEWLAGTLPFQGSSFALTHQHRFIAPPPLWEKVPTIPLAVEEVVLRALAKDPQQRFSSVRAFAMALERAYQHTAMQSYPTSSPHSTPRAEIALEQRGYLQPPQNGRPFRRRQKKYSIWREVAKLFAADLLIGAAVYVILLALRFQAQTLFFLLLLCIVTGPLLGAFALKNRQAFILASSIVIIAAVLGITFHSQILFLVVYIGLLLLSLLIVNTIRLHTTPRNK